MSLQFIDTHAHVYSDVFEVDRKEMMARALANGVDKIFVPAIDSETLQDMYAVQREFPNQVFLMMGLHPTHVNENYKEELQIVAEELKKQKFYAVGEIGVDLYWDTTFKKEQQEAFAYQIELALAHNLSINIHCRVAFDETFEVLESFKGRSLSGVFHCFTGNLEQAHKAIGYGLKLGIGGVATFKNGKIDQFLKEVPLEHIVLETDAPYLAPTPFRGKRNEPAYVVKVAEKLATIYNCSLEEISKVTTANAKQVFGM